jgi:Na+(H+)/acetate symporter ActP
MMKDGAQALWQPVGFTAGYLALLLFVAAPLRRYGAFTISDFAEARLESRALRLAASAIVLGIGGLYLVPQLKGAGISVEAVTGAPYWTGIVVIAGVVSLSVGL